MQVLTDAFDGPARPDTLLVLLPPAQAKLEDFYAQGFVAAVRRNGIPVDIALAEVTYQHVMANSVVSALRQHVVQPARDAGYRRIWLAGISLGAFSALRYAAEVPGDLAGVHLIAPYPGTADILAEIVAAGGPAAWARTPQSEGDDERVWWRWLCREARSGRWQTPVFLGTGSEDRFVHGQRLLAGLLPASHVRYVPGAHAWPTWQKLWQDWLQHGPLAGQSQRSEGAP